MDIDRGSGTMTAEIVLDDEQAGRALS